MLRYIGEREAADRVENAMLTVFEEGKVRTRDIGGTAKTAEFADAIIQKMSRGLTRIRSGFQSAFIRGSLTLQSPQRAWGLWCVKTRGPLFVHSTSSSIRTPIPRYCSGTSFGIRRDVDPGLDSHHHTRLERA